MQLFSHVNTRGFLIYLLESGKCDISRYAMTPGALPATLGNQESNIIQPIRIKEIRKADFDWSEFWKATSGNYELASVNTSLFPKEKVT